MTLAAFTALVHSREQGGISWRVSQQKSLKKRGGESKAGPKIPEKARHPADCPDARKRFVGCSELRDCVGTARHRPSREGYTGPPLQGQGGTEKPHARRPVLGRPHAATNEHSKHLPARPMPVALSFFVSTPQPQTARGGQNRRPRAGYTGPPLQRQRRGLSFCALLFLRLVLVPG